MGRGQSPAGVTLESDNIIEKSLYQKMTQEKNTAVNLGNRTQVPQHKNRRNKRFKDVKQKI